MGRRPTNNPRQIASKACRCPVCTAKFRPGQKPTSKDCIGSWQYRFTRPDGSPTSLNRATYDQAVADGEQAKVEIRQGTWIDPKRSEITLQRWYELWTPNLRGGDTYKVNTDAFWRNYIRPRFGGYPLLGIGFFEVQTWVNELETKHGLAPASIRTGWQLFVTLMRAARNDRRIPFNPCEGVKLPEVKPKSPDDRRPPSYAQLWLIRGQLPRYHHAMQILAQETGLRWGELTGLRACWVDLERRRIHVREVLVRVHHKLYRKEYPKSEAGYRSVPLTGLALRVLTEHLEQRRPAGNRTAVDSGMHPEELVFVARQRSRNGAPYLAPIHEASFVRTWHQACERAGVQRVRVRKLPGGAVRRELWPHWHDQRHAFASRLHERGVPEAVTQEILGHERGGKVTWLYTHAAADYAGQVLAAMDAWKGRAHGRLRLVS